MNEENALDDLESLSNQQHHQFIQWLINLILIDEKLNTKYDRIYQGSYYIKLFELLTYGFKYVNTKKTVLYKYSKDEVNWYVFLSKELLNLRNEISELEFKYIEYLRHNESHIFQKDYEFYEDKNGNIKKSDRFKTKKSFNEILDIHGNQDGFDIYITKKLHQRIVEINNQSKEIIKRHIMLIHFGL